MGIDVNTWTERALLDHGHFVRRLARTLVVDENEADELAQETWLVALRQAPGAVQRPRSWLAGVLRSLAFTRRRAESRRRIRAVDAEPREDAHSADREAEELESQQRVVATVLELLPPLRDVILLRYYRGQRLAEIALRTGVPLETVRTRLKRAQQLLREKLDRDYGDRASWCLALAALSPLPGPAATSLGITSLTELGGVIMSWKYVAATAAALLALLGIYWGLREDEVPKGHTSEPPAAEAMVEPVAAEEPTPGESVAVVEEPESPERKEAAVVPPPEEPATEPEPGVWLVGRFVGGAVETETPLQLVIDSARQHPWVGDDEIEEKNLELALEPPLEAELALGSPFEVDLTDLFERGEVTAEVEHLGNKDFEAIYDPEQAIGVLALSLRHDRFLPLDRRLEVDPRFLERYLDGERVEIEVELHLEPVGTTIAGSVVLPEGVRRRPIHVALFGFDANFSARFDGAPLPMARQHATCDRDGRFVVTVSQAGRAVLVVGTDGHRTPVLRPASQELEIELGESLQLPPIELSAGESIAGEVLETPVAAIKYGVRASLVGAAQFEYHLSLKGRTTSLKWIDETFELQSVSARTMGGGTFLLQGLAQQEYELTSAEYGQRSSDGEEAIPVALFEGGGLQGDSIGGLKVRAPAVGVALDPRPDLAGFQILGDGQPLEGAFGNLVWMPRAGGLNLGGRLETDEQGRARIAIGKGMELDCWVVFSAPGWLPHEALNAAELLNGEETFTPVELRSGETPVTLRLQLRRLDDGPVGSTNVTLRPWPEGAVRPDQRESPRGAQLSGFSGWLKPELGEFRIAGLQPGRYWCRLMPSSTRGVGAPWRTTRFELDLPARAEVHHIHEVGPGCHVRVLGAGLESYRLGLRTPEGWVVWTNFRESDRGAFQTTDPIDPGEYVVRVSGGPDGPVELPITAVDGEVVELKPELQPR